MKKCYTKIPDLIKEDIKYTDENYTSGLDAIKVYLTGYHKCLEQLNNYKESENIKRVFGKEYSCKYSFNGKYIVANIINNKTNEKINMEFEYTKMGEVKYISQSLFSTHKLSEEDINKYCSTILPEVNEYGLNCVSLMRAYDCSHSAMYSVNSKFSIYFVDDEAIVFPGNYSYFSITLDENKELNIDCHSTDVLAKLGLEGSEEKLLSNVYFNIDEAPLFIRDELYRLRKEHLENDDDLINDKQTLKRKFNWKRK